jgi:hypothetical protein
MDAPKYLYHYTTMETARLILENRTIRFNNLNRTDDVLESQTSDAGIAGKYVFVSCWSPNPLENILLWAMYSGGFSGVRLRMRFDPFLDILKSIKDIIPAILDSTSTASKPTLRMVIPLEHITNGKYTCIAPFVDQAFGYDSCVVKYTDDLELLKPKILEMKGSIISYNFKAVGEYKSKEWEIQNEVRYKIYAVPVKIWNFINGDNRHNVVFEGLVSMIRNEDLPIKYIDLDIDEDAFKDMEIMIGPKVDNDERESFIEFVKEKNPDCKIVNSNLQLRNHV